MLLFLAFVFSQVLSDDSMKFPPEKATLSPEAQARVAGVMPDAFEPDHGRRAPQPCVRSTGTGDDTTRASLAKLIARRDGRLRDRLA